MNPRGKPQAPGPALELAPQRPLPGKSQMGVGYLDQRLDQHIEALIHMKPPNRSGKRPFVVDGHHKTVFIVLDQRRGAGACGGLGATPRSPRVSSGAAGRLSKPNSGKTRFSPATSNSLLR